MAGMRRYTHQRASRLRRGISHSGIRPIFNVLQYGIPKSSFFLLASSALAAVIGKIAAVSEQYPLPLYAEKPKLSVLIVRIAKGYYWVSFRMNNADRSNASDNIKRATPAQPTLAGKIEDTIK